MLELFDRASVMAKIKEEPLLLVLIKTRHCSVCDAVLQKTEPLLSKYDDIAGIYFYLENAPECAADFIVFSSPTLILFAEGKEVYRAARFIKFEELTQKLEQYSQFFTADDYPSNH